MPAYSRIIIALFLAAALPATAAAQSLLIKNASVINVDAGSASAPHDVLVINGRIRAIAPDLGEPEGDCRTIDARGLHLAPGLWDNHTHMSHYSPQANRLLLESGVTSVRDMGGDDERLAAVIDSCADYAASGEAPTIYSSRGLIETTRWIDATAAFIDDDGHHDLADEIRRRIPVDDELSARRAVARLAAQGARLIKVRNFSTPEAFEAVCREARRYGLRVGGHAPTNFGPARAIRLGLASLEHTLLLAAFINADERESLVSDVRSAMLETDAAWCPTLVATSILGMGRDAALAKFDARFEGDKTFEDDGLLDEKGESWRDSLVGNFETGPDWERVIPIGDDVTRRILSPEEGGGDILVLVGTDAASPLVLPGPSVYEEIRLLKSTLGLSSTRVLQAATCNGADWLGVGHRTGRIRAGFDADLILLDGNPLEDLAALETPRMVIKAGVVAIER